MISSWSSMSAMFCPRMVPPVSFLRRAVCISETCTGNPKKKKKTAGKSDAPKQPPPKRGRPKSVNTSTEQPKVVIPELMHEEELIDFYPAWFDNTRNLQTSTVLNRSAINPNVQVDAASLETKRSSVQLQADMGKQGYQDYLQCLVETYVFIQREIQRWRLMYLRSYGREPQYNQMPEHLRKKEELAVRIQCRLIELD
mmetsp:Transcript_39924/g.76354  ORF Transcript_39924/g.76354 Transcript_39924/m.76354 type:complete len:198 (+) Transcript_39924:324-917(+)